MSISRGHINEILNDLKGHPAEMVDKVFPILYDRFRKYAANRMRGERQGHTLQPTEVVHDAWLILRNSEKLDINDRNHFFRLAAMIMRRLLVDHARRRIADKRGGDDAQRVTLTDELGVHSPNISQDVLELHDALDEFAKKYPRAARVIEQRYFGGNSVEETAEVLGVAPKTVKRDWSFARAWLHRRLSST
jgi:RNA polymerase sigma-70 factor (ECF subfamily)